MILTPVDGRARRRVSRVLDVADDDARLDIVWRGAIDDDLRAAEIDEVVRRDDRHARPFQAHLDVMAGGRLERAHAAEHRPARGHDDAGGAGLEIRDGRLADLVRDANLVGPVLSDLRLPRFLQAEERRLLAVLLEDDANRLQRLGVRRVDRDLAAGSPCRRTSRAFRWRWTAGPCARRRSRRRRRQEGG